MENILNEMTVIHILIALFIIFIIGCIFGDYLQGESYGGGLFWRGRTREEHIKYLERKYDKCKRKGN